MVNDFARFTAFGGHDGLQQLAQHTVAVLNAVTAIYRAAPSNGATFPYTAGGGSWGVGGFGCWVS